MSEVLTQIVEGIRKHESLPGISFIVNRVVNVSHSEHGAVRDLAEVVLFDPSLTQRVLRIANSAVYARNGAVETVTQAIMLLGFDTVRTIALSVILLDRLADPKKQRLLQAEIAGVLSSATMAQTIAEAAGIDRERSAIKALFRQMGRIVTAMYATPQYVEIKALAQLESIGESAAAQRLVGVRYEKVAEAALAEWNLPDEYREVPPHTVHLNGSALVAAMSGELTELLGRHAADHPEVVKFVRLHAEKLKVPVGKLQSAIATAREHFASIAKALGLPDAIHAAAEVAATEKSRADAPSRDTGHAKGRASRPHETRASAERNEIGRPTNYRDVLFHGIGRISAAVASDAGLTALVRLVTDTLQDAMGYQRSMFFFRDPGRGAYRVRYAVGRDADRLQRDLAIPLRSTVRSVFHAALDRDACIHIEDTGAEKVAPHLPPWFAQLEEARSFVLLPVVSGKMIVGAFYADRAMPDAASTPADLEMLVTLKNQVVLAVRTSQRRPQPVA